MSVAFRRDSDEEHQEPRFELPIPAGPNLVTPKGLSMIEARVAELEADVAGEGDAMRLAEAKRNLRYWRTRLATAQLMPPPPEDEVGFGSRVSFVIKDAARTIDIVGDDEADPAAGRIAFSAPLARALIGAVKGDHVKFWWRTGRNRGHRRGPDYRMNPRRDSRETGIFGPAALKEGAVAKP